MTSKQKIAGVSIALAGLWLASLACCSGATWIVADQFGTRRVVIKHEGGIFGEPSEAQRKAAAVTIEQNNAKIAALEAMTAADISKDREAKKKAEALYKLANDPAIWDAKRDAAMKAK
jgi:hypothetical protein